MKKILWILVIIFLVTLIISVVNRGSSTDFDLQTSNIGVIEIEGVIMNSIPVIEQIHRVKKNSQLKGLVVRVDSPGGAVGASQEIFFALKELKKEIPVVVSMGNVAASGGLYVSLGADKIYALPGTLTGSVGVLLQLTNVSRLLEKIYVDAVTLKSGDLKDAGNPVHPMSTEAEKYLKSVIMKTFDQFKTHVTQERSLSEKSAETLADGRVVDGLTAQELGLIDELGTFDDAIAFVMEKAKVEGKPKLFWLSRKDPSLVEYLMRELSTPIRELVQSQLKNTSLEYRFQP